MKPQDARFISPFTEAAFHVLSEVLSDGEIRKEDLSLRDNPHICLGIATIIGITGSIRGHVVLDMDKKTALQIASVMNGEEMAGVDGFVRSTINELGNMIAGHAITRLTGAGIPCEITPPTFLVGEHAELYAHRGMRHLIIPLRTRCGRITLSLAIVGVLSEAATGA